MISIKDINATIVYYYGNNIEILIKKLSPIFNEVIIVVNGISEDEKRKISSNLLSEYLNVYVIHNEKNLGIGHALNQGLQRCKDKGINYILTLDQDSIIDKRCVEKLAEVMDVNDGIVSAGSNYKRSQTGLKQKDFLITSGNLVSVDKALNVGGYNEDYFIDGIDLDFSYKLYENGYKLIMVGDAHIEHHIGNQKTSRLLKIKYYDHNPVRYYYARRNSSYLIRDHKGKIKLLRLKVLYSRIFCFFKILLIEDQKEEKILYLIKAIRDAKKRIVGELKQ